MCPVSLWDHNRATRVMTAMSTPPTSLRLCEVERTTSGSCGFHLSRTQWDPYPWVSGVEGGSPAEAAGLQTGDCVLEVNGEDILGRRIGQVADKVREKKRRVTLLLWNAGSDPHAAAGIYGGGATPVSLQRLSSCLQAVLQLLECPVCLETAPPPAAQCYNGHVLCGRCRARAVRCPVCRVPLGPRGRCLLADKLHNLLTTTFTHDAADDRRPSSRHQPVNLVGRSQRPLMQLKSRLLLQTKASSEENISLSNTEAKHIVGSALRVRSLSTGQLPDCDSNDLETNKSYGDQIMYSCPYIPN